MIKIYEVGGSIRDELLGKPSKDKDFVVIAKSFAEMEDYIKANGGEIFLSKPEFYTIRAKMPGIGAADFVLGRKDGAYRDGRRPESVEICSCIEEELARRDFTVNAMAREVGSSTIIDPFGGREYLRLDVLSCVGDPLTKFSEDGLRILRAFRFKITKGFVFDDGICDFLINEDVSSYLKGVSEERIREELHKMFAFNTLYTMKVMNVYPNLMDFLFSGKIWLKPSMEEP